jgi:NAD(P)-dependent dehydrogenase (short-subunit alcohol dehydrogenase family)
MSKVAYITGGTKGIGLGIAKALVGDGYNVVITGRSEESIHSATRLLNSIQPDSCLGVVADVRSIEDQSAAIEEARNKWGDVSVVVANAGIGYFAPIEELTPTQWNDVIDINLTGAFNTLKAALPSLVSTKGYYITIASLAGTNFFANGSAYNASKFGLVGFTQAVMLDLRKKDIKVSTIMPGSVATYFNNHVPNESDSWKIQSEDIGQIVSDLLKMNPRTLPSKIEVRPSRPPSA